MANWTRALVAVVASLWMPGAASAQGYSPGTSPYLQQLQRPTTSPYLNLLNRGNRSFALNYLQQVRPQQQFRSALAGQEQRLNRLRRDVDEQRLTGQSGASQLGPTGHRVTFLSLGGYYPTTAPGTLRR